MKIFAAIIPLLAAFAASAVTTTLEYEDQREAEGRSAISNEIARAVAPLVSTNDLAVVITNLQTQIENAAPADYASVSNKAMTALQADTASLTNSVAFTNAVALVSPPTDLTGYATENWVEDKGYLRSVKVNGTALTPDENKAVNVVIPDAPVTSVNNKTGTVVLAASDVGALAIPSELSQINDGRSIGVVDEFGNTVAIQADAQGAQLVAVEGSRSSYAVLPYDKGFGHIAFLSDIPTNVSAFANDAGYLTKHQSLDGYVPTSRTVAGKALASNVTLGTLTAGSKSYNGSDNVTVTASDLGAATTSQVSDLQAVVSTYTAYVDGSNVVFSVTNYISGAYTLDAAKLRILELRDGAYQEVYNSRDEIVLHVTNETAQIVGFVNSATNALAAALADKADKGWGKYTSAGGEAPSNTVYMTAPNTVFAGGMEYERIAVGTGTICVLTTKGAPTYTVGDEGTFHFMDDGGTNYFGYAKSDSYTIGASTDGISVANNIVTLTYNVTMSGVPCVWYKSALDSNADWEQLNTPDGSAISGASHTVTWEQSPAAGTEVCYINVTGQPKGFFKATIEVAGSAKFMTNMPADFSAGIFCSDGIHKVRINYNNGSPVLEVVQ